MVHSKINYATKRLYLRRKGINAFYIVEPKSVYTQFSLIICNCINKDYIYLQDMQIYYFDYTLNTLYRIDLF